MRFDEARPIDRVVSDLRALGVARGDFLILHSSFKSLGLSEGSPADVIASILEALGPQGTVMVPTFAYCFAGRWDRLAYHPDRTPCRHNGIITEMLRQWPGAHRSGHPTHSVAAVGRFADEVTRDKEHASPLGTGSSFQDALGLDARILLLGVGNNRNSMLHYAEVAAELPYNNVPFRAFLGRTALVDRDGRVEEIALVHEFPGCSENFGVADAYLDARGLLTHGKVAQADCMLMDSRPVVDALVERLREDPSWLLCDRFTCEACTLRKRRLRAEGLI